MDVRGMTIVFTGRFQGWRSDKIRRRLRELGATVTGAVSGKTDLLFASWDSWDGKNYREAERLGIPIGDEEALEALLDPDDGDDSGADGFAPGAEAELLTLRARLLERERDGGIGEEHRATTREIRAAHPVHLLHPDGHHAQIDDFALSPCGRYLATGASSGADRSEGGTLQIWELAAGRCVNIHGSITGGITGGIGRPGQGHGIQWSADGRRIGLAYQTNRIGVFDPFNPTLHDNRAAGEFAVARVTEEASEPPVWALAPDGRRAYVASGSPCEVGGCLVPMAHGAVDWTPAGARPSHPYLLGERLPDALRTGALRADRVRWSRDGTRLLAQGRGRGRPEAFVVNTASGQAEWVAGIGETAEWSPDDRLLAHCRDGLRFLDAATGRPTGEEPGHHGVAALSWGIRGAVPRLAALVGAGNAAGAQPGVLLHDEDRFRCRLEVTPVEERHLHRHSWAWSPAGDAGAWLTADGRVEVWSLADETPRRLRTLQVPSETTGVLWGAGEVLVALSPTTLRFLRTGSGAVLGDFTFLRRPRAPRPLSDAWFFAYDYFAPDDTTWCAAFGEGVVIAPDGRGAEALDDVLAWSVGKRVAWPVRWGGLEVVRDARAAGALLGDREGSGWNISYNMHDIERQQAAQNRG